VVFDLKGMNQESSAERLEREILDEIHLWQAIQMQLARTPITGTRTPSQKIPVSDDGFCQTLFLSDVMSIHKSNTPPVRKFETSIDQT
jgi:hypothetical protein